MKAIIAYIQPFMLEKVTDALRMHKMYGVSVIPCQGFGRQVDGKTPHYEDATVELGFAPKIKIEVVCRDADVPVLVRAIREHAHTGRHGDGKIFVMDVTGAVDIRTGTEGEAML